MSLLSPLRVRIVRSLGWFLLAAAAAAAPAQTLPAMPPTSTTSPGVPTLPPAQPNLPLHAEVTYVNGQLQVRADNSSLNQILRSISHQTGLKITGGVAEQRVFGTYGPAPLSTVLATLLDGTGTNILLLGGGTDAPPELILTQRNGGAEPPGPNSPTYAMYDDSTDRQPSVPPPGAHPVNQPSLPPPASGAAASSPAAASPAAGKALTPEMVMQELLKMQGQQAQKKQALDQKVQQEQIEQNRKLGIQQKPANQAPQNAPPPQ